MLSDRFVEIPLFNALRDGLDELLGETALDRLGGGNLGAHDELPRVALDRLDAVNVTTVNEGYGFT